MSNPQLENLEKKIATLEGEIFSLRSEFERAKKSLPAVTAAPRIEIPTLKAETAKPVIPSKTAATPSQQATVATASAQPQNTESGFSWEWLIGGNIIGKIGIVTLIVSTALFMVYALDQGWLSEWIRLLMLQAAFAGLSFLSYRLYVKEYKIIPEILAITALAANTIAIYSAHFVYRFLSRGETMAMMFALMVLSLAFARRIRSAALSMILFAGFFALPVIHSRGINEPKAYFVYLTAVNVLFFFLQRFKNSPHAIWVLILGNALSLFGWVGTYHQYATTPLFFCAFTLAILLYTSHTADWNQKIRPFFHPTAILAINATYALMIAAVISLNKNFSKEFIALAILCQGAINFLMTQILTKAERNLSAATLVVTLLLATGISIIMEGPAEKLVLAALLTAAMVVAARGADALLFYGIATVNGINLIALFSGLSHANDRWFFLNFQAAGFVLYTVAAIYMRTKALWPARFNFGPVLTGIALLTSFVCIITELQRVFTSKESRLLVITLVFAGYALLLLFIGFRRQKVWFRQAGLFFMGLAIAKFYFVDIWQWDKSIRILAGIIMGGGLVLISFYYEKFRNKFKEMGLILVLTGALLPSDGLEAAEKFKPNRFKFVKELVLKSESANGKTYGSVMIDAELYKSAGENDLRLAHDGKVVPFTRQTRKLADNPKVEKDIPVKDLVTSVDGENASILIFENSDRIRISGIKLNFTEKDYTREVLIYHRQGKFQPNILAKTVTLTRKAGKPELHTIDVTPISGEVQLQIRNDDDEALNLTSFTALSEKEFLVFRVPEKYADSNKKIQLFYGGEYAQKPKYDIAESLGDTANFAEFTLEAEKANPQYKLTIFDPPYSIWFFRTIFWLLLALIAWRMLMVYKKEKAAA